MHGCADVQTPVAGRKRHVGEWSREVHLAGDNYLERSATIILSG